MAPRLPPEILAHILTLAQEGEHPLDRRAIRWSFKHVCRDWYLAQDELAEICIEGVDQVQRMSKLLRTSVGSEPGVKSPLGLRVKSAYFGLFKRKGKDKAGKVARLLKWIPGLERIEFEVGREGLSRDTVLGDALSESLGKLKRIKHFAITRSSKYSSSTNNGMRADQIEMFAPNWPALRSFVLQVDFYVHNGNSVFASNLNLTHLEVERLSILADLPDNVTSIAVSGYHTRKPDTAPSANYNFVGELCRILAKRAPSLTHLSLSGTAAVHIPNKVRRGFHDQLISMLRDVRHLVIPVFAVTHLADGLSRLARLARLTVTADADEEGGSSAEAITAVEVAGLVLDAPALERLTLPLVTASNWSDVDRQVVKDAAERKGVKLVGASGWTG